MNRRQVVVEGVTVLADDADMRDRANVNTTIARVATDAIDSEKPTKNIKTYNEKEESSFITVVTKQVVDNIQIIPKIDKSVSTSNIYNNTQREKDTDNNEVNHSITDINKTGDSMNREAYERECERRRILMIQEKALKERYKRRIQQMTEIIDENDRLERRCKTLRRMIEELPEVQKIQTDDTDRSLMDDIKEIEQLTKPEVMYTDEIKLESPNEEYKVRADVVISVTDYIKKTE